MSILMRFGAYAADFEKTYDDDDWSRLRPYFADDARYEVHAEGFGCALVGPDAIFAGMKKSLDGFDRRFDKRTLAVTSGPDVTEHEVRVAWAATYRRPGLEAFVLPGKTLVRFAGDRIGYLEDSYDPSVGPATAAWMARTGVRFDPSYV